MYLNLCDQLVRELGKQIVNGEIKPGEVLPKAEHLSEIKGVSRTVVREAYKELSARRLVKSIAKVGTIVCPKSQWQLWDPLVLTWAIQGNNRKQVLRQLSEIRLAVEPLAAELAARNATEEDLAKIAERCKELEAIDGVWMDERDFAFHTSIVEASHNDLLINLNQLLQTALLESRKITLQMFQKNEAAISPQLSLTKHRAVWEAIRDRKPELARQTMYELIGDITRTVEKIRE